MKDKQKTIFELTLLALFTLLFSLYIIFPELKIIDLQLSENLHFTLTLKELNLTFLITISLIFVQIEALRVIRKEKLSINKIVKSIKNHLFKVLIISLIIVLSYILFKFLLGYLSIPLFIYLFGYLICLLPMLMHDNPNYKLSKLLRESNEQMKSKKIKLFKMDFVCFIFGFIIGIVVFYIIGKGNTDQLMILILAMISIQIPDLLFNRAIIYNTMEEKYDSKKETMD